MKEIWKAVKGYENFYSISSFGRVRSNGNRVGGRIRKILKPKVMRDGYLHFRVSIEGKQKSLNLHRQVAVHFLKNPKNKPQINHKDFDKTNNAVSNLEWVTAKENIAHLRASKPYIGSRGGLTKTKEGKKQYQREYFKTYIRKDRR